MHAQGRRRSWALVLRKKVLGIWTGCEKARQLPHLPERVGTKGREAQSSLCGDPDGAGAGNSEPRPLPGMPTLWAAQGLPAQAAHGLDPAGCCLQLLCLLHSMAPHLQDETPQSLALGALWPLPKCTCWEATSPRPRATQFNQLTLFQVYIQGALTPHFHLASKTPKASGLRVPQHVFILEVERGCVIIL